MPLHDTTQTILKLVEEHSGYRVHVDQDPDLPSFANVRMARKNVPAHFVRYKPATDDLPDYWIVYECGFILRLFANPPEQRFDLVSTPTAKLAQEGLSRLAQQSFRAAAPNAERPDAVMYCLTALQKFDGMPVVEVQKIAFEIAVLGSRGLSVNDPTKTYFLNSLPGEFTGLQLVCLMYVGFKQFAPEQDVGFDLAREYEMALQLHEPPKASE